MEKITAAEAKAAYQREWRRRNPGAAAKHIAAYWERKASAINKEREGLKS